MSVIDSFTGEYKFLSNFYFSDIVFENMTFRSVEHAYQAAKTRDPLLRRGIAVLHSPGSAKRVGNSIPLREDWESVKLDVMRYCIGYKFPMFVRSELSTKLMMTKDQLLIEGNKWHDNFWGICHCEKCITLPHGGSNHLGILLMARRDELFSTPE